MGTRYAGRLLGAGTAALAVLMALGLNGIDSAGGYAGLSARFVPTLVAIGLGLCALALVLGRGQDADGPDTSRPDSTAHEAGSPAQGKALAWVFAALLLHAAVIGVIGFPLASSLLMALVARGFGSRRWLRDALIGLALSVPVWLLFTRVLAINLPFFPWLR